MKTFACLLGLLSVVSISFADSGSGDMTTEAQRISNFVSGGLGSSGISQYGHDISLPSTSSSGSQGHVDPLSLSSSSDLSSVFDALSAQFNDNHFDPHSLSDLQSFIDTLHLDPAVISQLQMFVQNFDGNLNEGDNNNDNDENGENDNGDNDEVGDMDDDEGPAAIPEPSTFACFIAGAALLGGTLLRRRR
jgi:hypothetical protein